MQFEWLKQYWGDATDNFIVRGTPFNKGRMLRVLMDKGAKPVGDLAFKTPHASGFLRSSRLHAVNDLVRLQKLSGGLFEH